MLSSKNFPVAINSQILKTMAYNNNQFDDIEISSYSPPPIDSSSSNSPISPTILIAIVVTAVVFFVLGLLHLVVRYFRRESNPSIYNVEASGGNGPSEDARALRRQLQQLFHLHDSGLDHASLDALPIFYYRDIVCLDTGPRPSCFDCAVCLSGFLDDDRLRLLPGCGHAFHLNCIDAWLLSNSTCPLCRSSLVDSAAHRVEASDGSNDEFGMEEGAGVGIERRVFSVILGKFRKSEDEEEGRGCGLDGRRCYSMGSYQYIEGDLNMTVELSPTARNPSDATCNGKVKAGGNEEGRRTDGGRPRAESFSMSKIWIWSRNTKLPL